MIHPNSQLAHGKLSKDRHAAVLECYRLHGPLTDRQVAQFLGGENADPNIARPRISELLADGRFLEELPDSIADHVTGHKVRVCQFKPAPVAEEKKPEPPKPFCNCTFAGFLQTGQGITRCHNPIHGQPLYYGRTP